MKFAPFLVVLLVWPAISGGEEYRPPDYISCAGDIAGIVIGDEDKCAILSGNVAYGFGWDSKSGVVSGPPTYQSRLAVTASDIAAVVLGTRSSREYRFGSYAPGASVITFDGAGIGSTTRIEDSIAPGLDAYFVETHWLSEAFLSIGHEVKLRMGLIDTTFDSLGYVGDEKFLVPRTSMLSPPDFLLPSPSTSKPALQAGWQIDARTRHGAAFELGADDAGELIVRSDFALGDTAGRVLARVQPDSQTLDARFALDDTNQVVARAEHGSDGTWLLHGGIAYKPGPVGVGLFVARTEQDIETIASISVGDRREGVAGYVVVQELTRAQEYQVNVREIGTSIAIWTPLRLEAALGSFSGTLPYLGDLTYAKLKVSWVPLDGSMVAELTAETNSAGASKGVVRIENRLH